MPVETKRGPHHAGPIIGWAGLLTSLWLLGAGTAQATGQAPRVPAPPVVAAGGVRLPPPVIHTRERLIQLARRGQYEELERLALLGEGPFTYHLGFEKRRPAVLWRARASRGDDPLPRLVALLRTPPVRADDPTLFVWPAAAQQPSDAAWLALRGVYDPNRIQQFQRAGYTGWRVGIDPAGRWTMLLSGP
ncbi:MAG: hypothetical protein VKP62_11535 [Candidatus Sericytochromatia bacterium]|nr:hypothetical protein [Candidatus Sericytochromatia bacterium]